MLRKALPAAGPTETAGSMRVTLELRGAIRSATAGIGPNRDHWPRAVRGNYVSTHAHLGTACRETFWEPRAASGQQELRDLEQTYASSHAYLGTAGCGTRKGTVGCERAG